MTNDRKRLGFFTRVLDSVPPHERYQLALAQIRQAEKVGFDTAWVAQHHFHENEGGLPSPFVFLSHAAAQTSRLVLGTSIVTLPLEAPLRVAEDAAVLSLLSDGRFELGIASGGTPSSFPPFGHDPKDRPEIYVRHREQLVSALRGDILTSDDGALYPPAPQLLDTLWEATFSADGAARIGAGGSGLMLSKTQRHTSGSGFSALADTQRDIVDAYSASLPAGVRPRIFGSRNLVVVDDEDTARRLGERGIERSLPVAKALGLDIPSGATQEELRAIFDLHVGTPEQVIAELQSDHVLLGATDLVFQTHPIDPPHEILLRSLELIAAEVAPALGWTAALSKEDSMPDLIDELVGIAAGDHLDELRSKRPIARRDAQSSYDALIASPSDLERASAVERAAIGYWVAALSHADGLAEHYRALLADLDPAVLDAVSVALQDAVTTGPYGTYPPGPLSSEDEAGLHWHASDASRADLGDRLTAALEHSHLLTYRPRDSSADALQALLDAGWTTDGIVTISQLVAFTHFQLRTVAGLTALKEAN